MVGLLAKLGWDPKRDENLGVVFHGPELFSSVACLHQRMIAELLLEKQDPGKGYIPQCTSEGEFEKKQCSRNGLVCWCVDASGRKMPTSFGRAADVQCNNVEELDDVQIVKLRGGLSVDILLSSLTNASAILLRDLISSLFHDFIYL